MWLSRRSLRGLRHPGRGEEGPKHLYFFLLPSLPLPFPDVFCESLFFAIKTVRKKIALSAERILESLEQKGDVNNGISNDEESDPYRQMQETGDIYRARYKLSCEISFSVAISFYLSF